MVAAHQQRDRVVHDDVATARRLFAVEREGEPGHAQDARHHEPVDDHRVVDVATEGPSRALGVEAAVLASDQRMKVAREAFLDRYLHLGEVGVVPHDSRRLRLGPRDTWAAARRARW